MKFRNSVGNLYVRLRVGRPRRGIKNKKEVDTKRQWSMGIKVCSRRHSYRVRYIDLHSPSLGRQVGKSKKENYSRRSMSRNINRTNVKADPQRRGTKRYDVVRFFSRISALSSYGGSICPTVDARIFIHSVKKFDICIWDTDKRYARVM